MREDLKRWRSEADVLVVSAHWGSMYVDYPPPRVIELARVMSGLADVVLGHHPHVTQGFRREGRTLTLMSLGDAVFNGRAGDLQATVAAERRLESGVFTVLLAGSRGSNTLRSVSTPTVFPARRTRPPRSRLVFASGA